jgi:hypothetical protein
MNPLFDPSQLPLRDIHLPEALGWWPPALGWWLLALAAVGLLLVGWRRWRLSRPRRAALAALRAVGAELARGEDPTRCVQEASSVVRRFAMTATARPFDVAGLCGERWLAFLNSRSKQGSFVDEPGRLLATAPYRPSGAVSIAQARALQALCVRWVRSQPLRR